MAKRAAASADFTVLIGPHKSTIKVRGDDFPTCFAAASAASKTIQQVFRDAAKKKREESEAALASVTEAG